jgi:hypothetical protein
MHASQLCRARAAYVSDVTDADLARMERLLRDGKADLDVNSYIRMACELLAEVHRQRGLAEQTAASLRRQVGPLGAENERLHADLAKAQESNRNLLDWQREAERLRVAVEKLRRDRKSLRR